LLTPNQNWISKVQNPCYFIGIFVRIAANNEFTKQRTLFLPLSAKNVSFYGVVCGNAQCFVKKTANLPRFWILSLFFEKKSERCQQKRERNRQE